MARSLLPRLLPLLLLACLGLSIAGCGSSSSEGADEVEESRTNVVSGAEREPAVKLPKDKSPEKLRVRDLREGTGVKAREGDGLVTKFVAKYTDGQRFESSWDKGERPFIFKLGAEQSNPGWEKGLRGMRVGGLRELIIPADMASRFGPLPEGSDLVYVVELIGVLPPELLKREEPKIAAAKGAQPEDLQVRDLIEGSGAKARKGDLLTVEYVGVRYDGKPFSNSWKATKPFRFELGTDDSFAVSPGWEKGVPGMRVGGRRELVVPPELLEGGTPPDPQSIVFVIDLIGITEPDDVRE